MNSTVSCGQQDDGKQWCRQTTLKDVSYLSWGNNGSLCSSVQPHLDETYFYCFYSPSCLCFYYLWIHNYTVSDMVCPKQEHIVLWFCSPWDSGGSIWDAWLFSLLLCFSSSQMACSPGFLPIWSGHPQQLKHIREWHFSPFITISKWIQLKTFFTLFFDNNNLQFTNLKDI